MFGQTLPDMMKSSRRTESFVGSECKETGGRLGVRVFTERDRAITAAFRHYGQFVADLLESHSLPYLPRNDPLG